MGNECPRCDAAAVFEFHDLSKWIDVCRDKLNAGHITTLIPKHGHSTFNTVIHTAKHPSYRDLGLHILPFTHVFYQVLFKKKESSWWRTKRLSASWIWNLLRGYTARYRWVSPGHVGIVKYLTPWYQYRICSRVMWPSDRDLDKRRDLLAKGPATTRRSTIQCSYPLFRIRLDSNQSFPSWSFDYSLQPFNKLASRVI